MFKIKLISLSLFAVFAMSAFASASASAFSYLVLLGHTLTGTESETVKSSGGPATLQTTGTTIVCEEAHGTGTILAGGNSTYHIEFLTCRVEKPTGCTVHEPILVSGEDHLVLTNPGVLLDEFLPSNGNTFVLLTFLGATCSIAGTQAVEGKAGGEIIGGEEAKKIGELNFVNTSSNLTLGGVKANFKLVQKLELSGAHAGGLWAAMMN